MKSLLVRVGTKIAFGLAAAALLGLYPAIATAQSVRGHGKVDNGPGLSASEITVDAWLDDYGFAYGSMDWIGDIPNSPPESGNRPAGPADPWHIAVTEVTFNGDSAYVVGVVTHSVFPTNIGTIVAFTFTDNSDLGLPDEIDGQPILAGNFTVDDQSDRTCKAGNEVPPRNASGSRPSPQVAPALSLSARRRGEKRREKKPFLILFVQGN